MKGPISENSGGHRSIIRAGVECFTRSGGSTAKCRPCSVIPAMHLLIDEDVDRAQRSCCRCKINSGQLAVRTSGNKLCERSRIENSQIGRAFGLAGEPGFEPRQTESESVVLPLHHSPRDLPNEFNGLLNSRAMAGGARGANHG